MTLRRVELSVDVFTICLQHALTTEKEEIMGLLIGEVNGDSTEVRIVSSLILRRSDKRSDRVEISGEQLVEAAMRAEALASQFEKPLRVVGWYHSHPHITVWPSHIDLRTQYMYQNMDRSFVGLIFAVYLSDQASKNHQVQLTCFQSTPNLVRNEIPLKIVHSDPAHTPDFLQALVRLPQIFTDEEKETFTIMTSDTESEYLTKEHNKAVYTLAMSHIDEKITKPIMETMDQMNLYSEIRLRALQRYHQHLKEKIEEMKKLP